MSPEQLAEEYADNYWKITRNQAAAKKEAKADFLAGYKAATQPQSAGEEITDDLKKLANNHAKYQSEFDGVQVDRKKKSSYIAGYKAALKSRPELTQGQTGEGIAVGFAKWLDTKHELTIADYSFIQLLALYKQSPEFKSIHDSKTEK